MFCLSFFIKGGNEEQYPGQIKTDNGMFPGQRSLTKQTPPLDFSEPRHEGGTGLNLCLAVSVSLYSS